MASRILIYEDNQLLNESLCGLIALNEDFELVGSYFSADDVVAHYQRLSPDIILMDIDMPGIGGIAALKELRKLDSTIIVMMLTVFEDNDHVFDALASGASGYLLKKHISVKLFGAIQEVFDGGAPMSPSIARMVLSSLQKKPVAENFYRLTSRETEILASLSKGNSYKLIASDMEISIDTVRTHIKKIYEKLHVHSQTEAVSKAINEKIV